MVNTILGTKGTMSQAWTVDGRRVPVTYIYAAASVVTQVKTREKDGYRAVQLGFGQKKSKNITKPILGHLRKYLSFSLSTPPKTALRFLREVKTRDQLSEDAKQLKVGDVVKAQDILSAGDIVKVTSVSKGKGFAGTVKRWGFAGGPKTHGQSDRERAPGSIGQGTTPGRVYKGKHMAGHMGAKKITVRNLTVLEVGQDNVLVSGPVPGSRGTLLYIEKTGENKKFPGFSGRGQQLEDKEASG